MAEAMRPAEAFAACRADLAGGTLDLWPLTCLHPGAVTVNVALRAGVWVRLLPGGAPAGRILHRPPDAEPCELSGDHAASHLTAAVGFHFVPEGGFSVEVREQPPLGSGLGGSSAFAVALAQACLAATGRRRPPARALVAVLHDLEARVLAAPTGVQDYYPALVGGALAIHFAPGGERVERLRVPPRWIADRLAVVFTGVTHASGMVNWDVYRARVDGDRGVAAALDAVAVAAQRTREALLARDEDAVGRAVAQEWEARRTLAPAVESEELRAVIAAGLASGALAGKACGAGGGGSVLFWVSPRRREAVVTAVLAAAAPGGCEIPV